ncbi:MAG TPA: hypothetical protein VFO37_04490, partial [Chitinophagaceae bacterium]|nr:hypothetical protein [Chitinophagaceae bacterium]
IGKIGKTFDQKWDGPFTIIKKYSHGTYVMENETGVQSKPINGDRMKKYRDRLYMEPIIILEKDI